MHVISQNMDRKITTLMQSNSYDQSLHVDLYMCIHCKTRVQVSNAFLASRVKKVCSLTKHMMLNMFICNI